jgi:hypothetical protein
LTVTIQSSIEEITLQVFQTKIFHSSRKFISAKHTAYTPATFFYCNIYSTTGEEKVWIVQFYNEHDFQLQLIRIQQEEPYSIYRIMNC